MSGRPAGTVERVLVHLNSLQLGGTQINALDLAARLRQLGIQSILLGASETLPTGPSMLDIAADRGIEVEVYDAAPSMMTRSRQLTQLAKKHDVDLVHVYGSWGGAARPTYWGFSRFGRNPWVQTVWEMEVSSLVKRRMPMIVGTGYLVDDMRDRPGLTRLISPPVDTELDRPDPVAGAAFRAAHDLHGPLLVIVSRLDLSMKSIPIGVAIEAMRTLGERATLAIVGTGDNAEALHAAGAVVNAELGRDAVRFIGPMSDPRPAYAAADIMIGMGGSAARALAFGKPLVVHGEAGRAELFEESTSAALARYSYWSDDEAEHPVELFSGFVTALLDDEARREELGAFGREFAIGRFGLTKMADDLAAFYREAAVSYGGRQWFGDLPSEIVMLARKIGRKIGLGSRLDDEAPR